MAHSPPPHPFFPYTTPSSAPRPLLPPRVHLQLLYTATTPSSATATPFLPLHNALVRTAHHIHFLPPHRQTPTSITPFSTSSPHAPNTAAHPRTPHPIFDMLCEAVFFIAKLRPDCPSHPLSASTPSSLLTVTPIAPPPPPSVPTAPRRVQFHHPMPNSATLTHNHTPLLSPPLLPTPRQTSPE